MDLYSEASLNLSPHYQQLQHCCCGAALSRTHLIPDLPSDWLLGEENLVFEPYHH